MTGRCFHCGGPMFVRHACLPYVDTPSSDRSAMMWRLRDATGATLLDCSKAISESGNDERRAVEWLRARMLCR